MTPTVLMSTTGLDPSERLLLIFVAAF